MGACCFPRMNRAIPVENSKLWLMFLMKTLSRLNGSFRWLCSTWLENCTSCEAMAPVCSWESHWEGVLTCLLRPVAASVFPHSFYSGALLLGFCCIPPAFHCARQFGSFLGLQPCTPTDESTPVKSRSCTWFVAQLRGRQLFVSSRLERHQCPSEV